MISDPFPTSPVRRHLHSHACFRTLFAINGVTTQICEEAFKVKMGRPGTGTASHRPFAPFATMIYRRRRDTVHGQRELHDAVVPRRRGAELLQVDARGESESIAPDSPRHDRAHPQVRGLRGFPELQGIRRLRPRPPGSRRDLRGEGVHRRGARGRHAGGGHAQGQRQDEVRPPRDPALRHGAQHGTWTRQSSWGRVSRQATR